MPELTALYHEENKPAQLIEKIGHNLKLDKLVQEIMISRENCKGVFNDCPNTCSRVQVTLADREEFAKWCQIEFVAFSEEIEKLNINPL